MIITDKLHTIESLHREFKRAGVQAGMTVLVHSSMKQIGGWVAGGAESVLHALLGVLGDAGTLMMPTHTANNTDPIRWENPPIPQPWWQTVREQRPPYDPVTSATYNMGILPETFRCWHGVKRSPHPIGSFAAKGRYASDLTAIHELESMFGDQSPLGALYALDGYVLLLGVGYNRCTSLHLAEYRASYPKTTFTEGTAMLVDGQRQWVTFEMLDLDSDDFELIGTAYESYYPNAVQISTVGNAPTHLLRVRPLVDFAQRWMSDNRSRAASPS